MEMYDIMSRLLRVLMVDGSEDGSLLIATELRREGFEATIERVATRTALQAALDRHEWDLIICDYSTPQLEGPAALAIYREKGLDVPFISLSCAVGEETSIRTASER